MEVSRRDFVKMVGAGVAAAGISGVVPARSAAASAAAGVTAAPMPKEMEADIRSRMQVPEATDPLAAETVQIAANMEPVIPHAQQAAEAIGKLAALGRKTGKKLNILIFLMDNLFSHPIVAHKATFQAYPGKKARLQVKIEEHLHSN